MLLQQTQKEINKFIEECQITNIISIYGIGSIAKKKEGVSDIDLNVFLNNCDFASIMEIDLLKNYLMLKTGKEVDFNIVDMSIVKDGLLESDLFPHKNRHSLFLYELSQLDCLIYGKPLLKNLTFESEELTKECVKLTLTLVQRFNKELLTKRTKKSIVTGRKFSKYAIEFGLIAEGVENPYVLNDLSIIYKIFPELKQYSQLIEDVYQEVNPEVDKTYNFILFVSHLLKKRFIEKVR